MVYFWKCEMPRPRYWRALPLLTSSVVLLNPANPREPRRSRRKVLFFRSFMRVARIGSWLVREHCTFGALGESRVRSGVRATPFRNCHPERSEGSVFCGGLQIPHFVRDNNSKSIGDL